MTEPVQKSLKAEVLVFLKASAQQTFQMRLICIDIILPCGFFFFPEGHLAKRQQLPFEICDSLIAVQTNVWIGNTCFYAFGIFCVKLSGTGAMRGTFAFTVLQPVDVHQLVFTL